jgi:4-diphosphocytidyl-2-C-methyl-D-erythritol kinase
MNIINQSLNPYFILLVKPPFEISTALAFKNIIPQRPLFSLAELIAQPIDYWKDSISNQFEWSVFQAYPELGQIKDKLYQHGALYASMSGSGSCMYGIFRQLPANCHQLFPSPFLTFSQQL